jgi:hypothetical protein
MTNLILPVNPVLATKKASDLSFYERRELDVAAAIKKEKKSTASIKRMAKNNRESLLAIWHWGDGNGGAILDMIAKEIGAWIPSEPTPPAYKVVKGKKVIPSDLRRRVFERNAYRCLNCGTHMNLTVDHIKPESKGGTLDFDNLQTLCAPCNSAKGTK